MKLLMKDGDLKMDQLRKSEIRKVSEQFSGVFKTRNKGLFMLGVSTGADIKELLALTIGDVYRNGKPVDKLFFNNRDEVSRTVSVNQDGIKAIQSLIDWHVEHYGNIDTQRPLFPSRNGRGKVALSSRRAHEVLRAAFIDAGLNDKVETDSLPKSTVRCIFVMEMEEFHHSSTMPIYFSLSDEINIKYNRSVVLSSPSNASVKDSIIKLVKQGIPVVIVIKQVVIVIRQAHEWLPILLEFISDLASVLEFISGIF